MFQEQRSEIRVPEPSPAVTRRKEPPASPSRGDFPLMFPTVDEGESARVDINAPTRAMLSWHRDVYTERDSATMSRGDIRDDHRG
jgi:hypothetical protein